MQDASESHSILSRVWLSPYFAAVTGLCTIAGVGLAIYFYSVSRKERRLVYTVPGTRTIVADPSESSALRVTFGGRPVSKVTGLQLVFWNAGSESIRTDNLLEPIRIRTRPATPILEVKLRRAARAVCKVQVDTTRASVGEVIVTWRILEPGDGAQLQLLHSGGIQVDAVMSGTVEGRHAVSRVDYEALWRKRRLPWQIKYFPVITMLGSVVAALYFWIDAGSKLKHRALVGMVLISLVVVFCFLILWTFGSEFWQQFAAPSAPFEF